MNKKKVFKKIFSIFFIILFLCLFFNSINAATNSQYSGGGLKVEQKDSVFDTIGKWIQDTILGIIGKIIAAVGFMVEVTVRGACGLLTIDLGNTVFPWADRVIFNGMALLDVNFINPEPGSLFMNTDGSISVIGNSIRKIYFTSLSISIGFLGIIVAVMAIRLALSSIGSEKAKYKEAIVHWLTALVLVFGMHYVISFVFYINEQLVEIASSMVLDLMEDKVDVIENLLSAQEKSTPIEMMGVYFRNTAFSVEFSLTPLGDTETFIASVLYCIFIIQSLLFFYSYLKRFFYVTILALISPFVVVYDFLVKSVS